MHSQRLEAGRISQVDGYGFKASSHDPDDPNSLKENRGGNPHNWCQPETSRESPAKVRDQGRMARCPTGFKAAFFAST